jgi:hypothetical protein
VRSENAHHQRKDANKENICAGTAMRTLVSGLNQDALMLDSLALSATISYRYEFIFVDSTS